MRTKLVQTYAEKERQARWAMQRASFARKFLTDEERQEGDILACDLVLADHREGRYREMMGWKPQAAEEEESGT